jgi:Flp pilus assembly protein TadB
VMIFPIIASLLLIVAVVLLFGLTPERITDDMMKIISPKQTLRDKVKIAQGKKKSRKLSAELKHINDALIATGKGSQFATICAVSLTLLICGGMFAVLIDNIFLVPIFAIALALLPFIYAKTTISYYDKHIEEEMETALSIITTSYIRSDDIVSAVKENITYLKPPITEIFKSFLGETTAISSDIKHALHKLKERIDNQIFKEWVDTLIQCQYDRTLKDTLLPVVTKLTDVRIVNNELKTMLYEPRKEYFMMVAMVVGNIPLLYMLNKSWYSTLMDTLPGKFVLALSGVVILVTALLMMKYTKPIEYRR